MERLEGVLSKILGVEKSRITDAMSPNDTPSWDSFNALMMVSELEAVYGLKFTMDEVSSVTCVGDIRAVLRKHGVAARAGKA